MWPQWPRSGRISEGGAATLTSWLTEIFQNVAAVAASFSKATRKKEERGYPYIGAYPEKMRPLRPLPDFSNRIKVLWWSHLSKLAATPWPLRPLTPTGPPAARPRRRRSGGTDQRPWHHRRTAATGTGARRPRAFYRVLARPPTPHRPLTGLRTA